MLEAWLLQMRFIYWRLFIYSIYSSCILCDWHLFGRPSFAQSCFVAGLLSIHYKNGKQVGKRFQLEFHWRKFIVGFTPVWWESSSFLLKIQCQDCWLFITCLSLKACRWPHIRCSDNIVFWNALYIRVSIKESSSPVDASAKVWFGSQKWTPLT